jgi:hypothetical protein
VELREPQRTNFKNEEKAMTIESKEKKNERMNSIANANDVSDAVAPNLASLNEVSAKNTSPPVAAEKPKDIKAPDLILEPTKVEEKHELQEILIAEPNLTKDPPAVPNTFKRSTTVIIILACKRPHYLEQTLNSLMRLEGVGEYTIVISQDGHEQGVRNLAASFVNRHQNIRPAHSRHFLRAPLTSPSARTHATHTHLPSPSARPRSISPPPLLLPACISSSCHPASLPSIAS